jgi:hypothetical protein
MELLECKSSCCLLNPFLILLLLHVGALSRLTANLTDKFENSDNLLFIEFKAHHKAFMYKIVSEYKFIVLVVKYFVCLFDCEILLFELLSEFVDKVHCVINSNLEFKAASY